MNNLQRSGLVVGLSFLVAVIAGYWVPWGSLPGRRKPAAVRAAADPGPTPVVASDPLLLQPATHMIRDGAFGGPTGAGQGGIPYLVELADGRYVFGKTDDSGHTRAVYTDERVAHRTTWGDDAVTALERRRRQEDKDAPKGVLRAGNRPTTPVHRWRDMLRDMEVDRSHASAALPPYGARVASVNRGGGSCRIAISGDSPVAEACARGGLPEAKKTMKQLITWARAIGQRFMCEGCHKNLDDFELASDARDDFRKLLEAARAGAPAR